MMVSAAGPGRDDRRDGRAAIVELIHDLPAAVAYLSGPDLVYELANEEYQRLVGERDLIGVPLREALPELEPERLEAAFRAARTGERLWGRELEVWVRRPGQEPEQLFVDFAYQPVRDNGGHVTGLLVCGSDVTGHVRDRNLQHERAALLAREQAARGEADAAWERLRFLLRAGDLVAATWNPDDLLEKVTQLVVPALADYCVAFRPTEDGQLRASKVAHRDPARAETLMGLREHPFPASGPLLSQAAYTTGTTQLASEFSAGTPAWAAAAPEVMKIESQARTASALAVPLLADQHPLGVLVLGRGESRARFVETDAAVVEELGRRLAAGLANAETFAREHTVAEALQHALLPDVPPAIEGLDMAVRYLPASDSVHVGGDWYDVFPVDRGRVGLAIGDVAGHSIASAAIMGQVRSLLHGYAIDDPSPPGVLRRTNAALGQMLPDALATVWYAVLDPATGDLAYANAGHPPPLVSSGQGHAEYLDATPATMLGVSPGTMFTATLCRLPPRARLLLYTDGLIEDRQRDIADGLAALAAALAQSPGRSAEEACRSAQESMLGSAPRADDVCILAIGLQPANDGPAGCSLGRSAGLRFPRNSGSSSPRRAAGSFRGLRV